MFGIRHSPWCQIHEFDTLDEVEAFIIANEVKGFAYISEESHGPIFECCQDDSILLGKLQKLATKWKKKQWGPNVVNS